MTEKKPGFSSPTFTTHVKAVWGFSQILPDVVIQPVLIPKYMHFWILIYNSHKARLEFVGVIDWGALLGLPRAQLWMRHMPREGVGDQHLQSSFSGSKHPAFQPSSVSRWMLLSHSFFLSCLSPPCSLLSLSFHARFPLPGLNVESVLS